MADRTRDGLLYGQFGQAIYDTDEQAWRFERSPNPGRLLETLGEPTLTYGAADDGNDAGQKGLYAGTPSQRHAKQINDLVKAFPEVQPASNLLSPLLGVSEAVESATARHDPLKGSLLAVGSIPSEVSRKSMQITAFPYGPTGSDLRLVEMRIRKRGWDDTKDAWIEVPVVRGEEELWLGEGAPIQQVCFAHALEGSDAFLAVRMITRTLIFRPALRRGPACGSTGSRFDANRVFELPISSTGNIPHADVAFNPWYTRQFGMVDQAGHWSIWELEGRATRAAKRIREGSDADHSSYDGKVVADGWARITWVCNPSVVAVATRLQLCLSITMEDPASSVQNTVLDFHGGQGWILDIAVMPSHPAHLCVLTSELLQVYFVRSDGISISAMTVSSVRHYRNAEDVTLGLTVLEEGGELVVMVRSNVDPLTVSFRLRVEDDERIAVYDPMSLETPGDLTGLHFASVAFGARTRQDENCTALRYRDRGVRFLNLICLRKDLALSQQLCTALPSAPRDPEISLPTWESALGLKSSASLRKESFVVEDDDAEEVEAEEPRPRHTSLFVQRQRLQAGTRKGAEWTIDFQLTAGELQHVGAQQPFGEILDAVEDRLKRQAIDDAVPVRTLHELGEGEGAVGDVEGASTRLRDLAFVKPNVKMEQQDDEPQPERTTRLALRNVQGALLSGLGSQDTGKSMFDIYNSMVGDWITPLSASVPGRVRLAKERLVRCAAAEVTLASHVVRVEDVEQQPQPESQESQQQQTWELPVRGGTLASSSQATPSSQYLGSSQLYSQQSILPTPSPSATPSVTTASSATSIRTPELSRLGKYTTFSKPPPSALPRSLNNVIAHWQPGADPSTYDWLTNSRRLRHADAAQDDDAAMTEKERARMQKRAERHIRRQRREAAASQAAQMASSQAPEIAISASQPQAARVGKVESQPAGVAASSQSQGLGFGVPSASQVIPGRFGGRPPAKKKRKQGF